MTKMTEVNGVGILWLISNNPKGGHMLTDRQNQILSYIWENDKEFIQQATIASEFDISTRLVQMEIKEINNFLNNIDGQIKTKRNHGVYIEITNEEYLMEYFKTVDKKEQLTDLNNPRQRMLQIIEYLLYQNEFTHYETLCDKFLISKSTLSSDLDKIKAVIEKQNLLIESNQVKGIRIAGLELNKRRMLMNIFNSEMNEGLNPEYLNESELMEDISDKLIEIFIQKHYKASDVVIQNIIMHIYVATKRVLAGQHLIYNLTDDERVELKNELEISEEIYNLLGSTYDFEICEGEVNHLAFNIYAKRNHYRKDVITTEIDNHVLSILEIVKDKWMIDLSYDIELRIALALHLVPLKKRLEKDMQLPNTMEQEIMQNYSLGYELAIIAGKYFEELTRQKISNSEISYLALHFNLSVEKLDNQIGKKKILVITSSRRGETLLINNRLKKWFPDLISNIDFVNIFELLDLSEDSYDVILSTTLNHDKIPKSAIKINYFLKEIDRAKIERALLGYSEYDSIISYFKEELFLNFDLSN